MGSLSHWQATNRESILGLSEPGSEPENMFIPTNRFQVFTNSS